MTCGTQTPLGPRRPPVAIDRLEIDDVTFEEAVALIVAWAADGSGGYICTPNVDHVVMARRDRAFRSAVMGARLRVPDGMGIVYGSRVAGRPLRATVTGRLLPEAVGGALAHEGLSIGLVGGSPAVAQQAGDWLRRRGVSVAVVIAPSTPFVVESDEDRLLVRRLQRDPPGVLFLSLGAPKQEVWMATHTSELPDTVLVGIGAGIDVLGGRVPEAPRWMTQVGLEWLFRLINEPRRLARRYLWDDPRFFVWMLQSRLSGR